MTNSKLPPPLHAHSDERGDGGQTENRPMRDRNILYPLWKRIGLEYYTSSWLILGLDTAVSVCATLTCVLLYDLLASQALCRAFLLWWLFGSVAASVVMFLALHTYRAVIRYSTLREIGRLGLAVLGKVLLLGVLLFAYPGMCRTRAVWLPLPDFLLTFGLLVLLRVCVIAVYDTLRRGMDTRRGVQRILIYGTGRQVGVIGHAAEELAALSGIGISDLRQTTGGTHAIGTQGLLLRDGEGSEPAPRPLRD